MTWTTRKSGVPDDYDALNGVTFGNSTFVAVGDNGAIIQSGTIATTEPTPTPSECTATAITVSANAITIKKLNRSSVTITVTGNDGCEVKDEKITAKVDASGKKMVTVTPASVKTGEDGSATFKLKAKSKTGATKVTFSTAGGLSSSVDVTITK